jgi:hypothetical protein
MINLKEQLLKLIDRRFLITITALILFYDYCKYIRNTGTPFSDVQVVLGFIGIISAYLTNRVFSDKKDKEKTI